MKNIQGKILKEIYKSVGIDTVDLEMCYISRDNHSGCI